MAKKFFIKSSNDLILRELDKLQNKINFLEDKSIPVKKQKRTAVYSPSVEVEATHTDLEFETDDDMFGSIKK